MRKIDYLKNICAAVQRAGEVEETSLFVAIWALVGRRC
jgi:hypothetical protein